MLKELNGNEYKMMVQLALVLGGKGRMNHESWLLIMGMKNATFYRTLNRLEREKGYLRSQRGHRKLEIVVDRKIMGEIKTYLGVVELSKR